MHRNDPAGPAAPGAGGPPSQEVLGVGLALGDAHQVEAQLLVGELEHVGVVGELHGPAAHPVPDVGEVAHAALEAVLVRRLDDVGELKGVAPHREVPDVPPDEPGPPQLGRADVALFDLQPLLRGGVDLHVRGVQGDVEQAALPHGVRGVADRRPLVSGVVEHTPGVDDVELAQGADVIGIQH